MSQIKFNANSNIYSSDIFLNKTDRLPEIALWRAVILQAVLDASTRSKKPEMKRIKAKAIEWIDSSNPDFLQVCEFANYSHEYVLKKAKHAILNDQEWKRNSRNLILRPTKHSQPTFDKVLKSSIYG